jgi:DNA repair protein RadC
MRQLISRVLADARVQEQPSKEVAMSVDRFATIELRIHKEQPSVVDLEALLADWGLTNSTQERVWVVTYDSIEQVRTVQEVVIGGYHEVAVPLPPLLTAVLMAGTDRFRVVHNHPSGDTQPTMFDVEMVHLVMSAANAAGLYFEDSLIVGPNAPMYSFLANGLIVPAPEIERMANEEGGHARAPFTR